jgi:CRISPR/Cas system CSM-associated protein Csm4 (group 5 of RAMP superfamily)
MGLLLSTYIPTTSEILEKNLNHDGIAYQIVRRGGWITQIGYNTQRKNAIYAFDAGSVLCGLESGKGAIVDLAPEKFKEHKIWRCGKSIVLPIKI